MPWVAPNALANSSLLSTRSTAITGSAPAIAAAQIAASPTPPAPNTATDWPARTFAVCSTAPTLVSTAQPIRQVISVGSDSGIGTTLSAKVTMSYRSPRHPGRDDVIAFLDVGDVLPHAGDHAAAFMAEAHGPGHGGVAQLVDLGIANTAGEVAHDDLVRAGIRDVDFVDYQRSPVLDLDGGLALHDGPPGSIRPLRVPVPAGDQANT